MLSVGIREQYQNLTAAVFRDNIALPESFLQNFNQSVNRLRIAYFLTFSAPLERKTNQAGALAVETARALEKPINRAEILKRYDKRSGVLVALIQNHLNLRDTGNADSFIFALVIVAVNAVAVLAVLLDDIQRLIRLFVQVGKVRAAHWNHDAANRRAQRNVHILAHKFLSFLGNALVDKLCLLRDRRIFVNAVAERYELVAAHSSQQIRRTHRRPQNISKRYQNFIAHRVPVNIVDKFETVEVNHHQRAG